MADKNKPLPKELVARLAEIIRGAYEGRLKFAQTMARVGVSFSPEQEQMIKELAESGEMAQAQALILDGLKEEFDE